MHFLVVLWIVPGWREHSVHMKVDYYFPSFQITVSVECV